MARRTKKIDGTDDGVRMFDAIRRLEDLMTESGPGFDAPEPSNESSNALDPAAPAAPLELENLAATTRAPPRRATRITGKSKTAPEVAVAPPTPQSTERASDWGVPVARSLKAPPPRPVAQPAVREPVSLGELTDAREIAAAMRAAVPAPVAKPAPSRPAPAADLKNAAPARSADELPDNGRENAAPQPLAIPIAVIEGQARRSALVDRVLARLIGSGDSEVKDAIAAEGGVLQSAWIFSGVMALLALSIPALAALITATLTNVQNSGPLTKPVFGWTMFAAGALTAAAALWLVRARILARAADTIDRRIERRLLDIAVRDCLHGAPARHALEQDLRCLRAFLSGPAVASAFDCIWSLGFIAVLALCHMHLGLAALVWLIGGVALARFVMRRAAARIRTAERASSEQASAADMARRDSEALAAMGMHGVMRSRMAATAATARAAHLAADDTIATAKIALSLLRSFARLMMFAAASWLALHGAITPATAIASYVLFELALAPAGRLLNATAHAITAIDSIRRIDAALAAAPLEKQRDDLPKPSGAIAVSALRVARPGARGFVLNGITFATEPGRIVAVTGPSGSGKSALLKAIAGVWPAFGGSVTIDGTRVDQWHPGDLGRHIGFLSQDAGLFPGTIGENIARFDTDAAPAAIVAAAGAARAGATIAALADGMATRLGPGGAALSAGERQRIALARALYANPAIVLLDDPSAHLDRQAAVALRDALHDMRTRRQTVIIATEDEALIAMSDVVLALEAGRQTADRPSLATTDATAASHSTRQASA